jgi:hypothetical protein
MHASRPEGRAPFARLRGSALLATVVAGGLAASACLSRPLCDTDCRPRTTNIFVDTLKQTSVDKIDLLFMIDNSSSMADKQAVLRDAVPDLVKRLVSPTCVSASTGPVVTPTNPDDPCPSGSAREFKPIRDIHIGVITSSLGGHGGAACSGTGTGLVTEEGDDHGHLVATRPRFAAVASAGFPGGQPPDALGFLDWNPVKRPGQSIDAFKTTFEAMVVATDEHGCGYEAQLESIYRFLADPNPPASIGKQSCPGTNVPCAVPVGRDTELLRERAAFLRPDSLVAIIMMTDENDCSLRDSGQAFLVAEDGPLPRASAACVTNPNDPCCYPCGSKPPAGCAADPTCATAPIQKVDETNLRCFEQKRRFGADLLYPTDRYVNALSHAELCTSRADLAFDAGNRSSCPDADGDHRPDIVVNPLFAAAPGAPGGRAADDVFLAGIVGVPWQDIQRPPTADAAPSSAAELHYKTAKELADDHVWDVILGEPRPPKNAPPVPPLDQLMVESTGARGGSDGESPPRALAGKDAAPMANPVNGHEWANLAGDDLQYACIFPMPVDQQTHESVRHCASLSKQNGLVPQCDCNRTAPGDDNPLCQNPTTGEYGTDQYYAKAYPGLRELAVLRDFGKNAIVASICARKLGASDVTAQDYGYRPAVDAIVERLKEALNGKCLPRVLKESEDPQKPGESKIPCSVVEVLPKTTSTVCDPSRGRSAPSPKVMEPIRARLAASGVCDGPGQPACADFLVCEIDEAGEDCHHGDAATTKPGWCYVDPANHPERDDPSLVAKCDPSERRILRFVDDKGATPAHGAQVLIACFGADLGDE